MKKTLFASVNGREIYGEDILRVKKRLVTEHEDEQSFAYTPNENNNAFLNSEALQKAIDICALTAIAKFEGITIEEDMISNVIFDLRSQYQDEAEWESVLHDLKIDEKNLREEIGNDIMIDMLMQSRLEHYEDIDDETAVEFYNENQESIKTQPTYTFIELEAPSQADLQTAVSVISEPDTQSISKAAAQNHLPFSMNEDIPKNRLPESLQSILEDLEESKVGTIATEENSIVLIKLIRKIEGVILPLEQVLPGLKEYLKIQQNKSTLDSIIEEALEKCDIKYYNSEQLKELDK